MALLVDSSYVPPLLLFVKKSCKSSKSGIWAWIAAPCSPCNGVLCILWQPLDIGPELALAPQVDCDVHAQASLRGYGVQQMREGGLSSRKCEVVAACKIPPGNQSRGEVVELLHAKKGA